MSFRRLTLLITLLATCVISPTLAQDSTKKEDSLCLRARPAPHCGTIVVTNVGVYGILGTVRDARAAEGLRFAVDWGVLKTVGRHSAVGLTVLASEDADGAMIGPAFHYRHWSADERSSVEVAVGMSTSQAGRGRAATRFGMLKLSPTPAVGITVRPEWRRSNEYSCLQYQSPCTYSIRGRFAVSIGIELSGPAGLIGTLPGLLAMALHQLVNIDD